MIKFCILFQHARRGKVMNISLKCLEVNFVIQAILCWCFERSKDESVSGRRFKHIQIICSLLFSPWMKKLKIPFSPLLSWWCWCMGVFHLISYSCCIKLVMPYWTIWIHNITLYICCWDKRQKVGRLWILFTFCISCIFCLPSISFHVPKFPWNNISILWKRGWLSRAFIMWGHFMDYLFAKSGSFFNFFCRVWLEFCQFFAESRHFFPFVCLVRLIFPEFCDLDAILSCGASCDWPGLVSAAGILIGML